MKFYSRPLRFIEEWVIILMMALATFLIFLSVVHRYFSAIPIPYLQDWLLSLRVGWAQELSIIMFVWMAKIGAAYGVRTGIHIGVDIVVNKVRPSIQKKLHIIALLGGIIFTGLLIWIGTELIWKNGANYFFLSLFNYDTEAHQIYSGPISADLEWPTWMIYSAVPIGSFLMCLHFIETLVIYLKTGVLPHATEEVPGVETDAMADTKEKPTKKIK